MKDCDYLLPPGEEVCAGSAAEAFALFRTAGVDIRQMPVLGTIRRRSHPQTTYCVWADCEKEFHVLPLFPAIGIPECGDWEFAPLESGEMIMYVRRRTYLVGYDKMLGRCIRNVSFYWHERYAIGEGAILGYPNARYMLCRLFVTEENSRFLTCCWIGYDETANATLFIKLFEEDWELLAGYSYTELGCEAIDVGERFEMRGKSFVLKEDENGYRFLEPSFHNPNLRLVKKK